MSDKINDGGPAFPFAENGEVDGNYHGMSLRDYFAAAALKGDWAAQDEYVGVFIEGCETAILDTRAQLYYRMADAMLKARQP